jgi:hypothetical protein
MTQDPQQLQRSIKAVEDWRKISDNLFQVGPLKVGLDGVLTWFPGVGDAYGLGASGYLLYHAHRAGASNATMTKMALLLGTDAVVGAVPLAGDVFDMVFRAHARAARILLKELKTRPAAPAPTVATSPRPATSPPPRDRRPTHSEAEEWEQARRVEALRAEVQGQGGGIVRPRP